ncbi:MAG: recombinase family protein [Clostridia bacterium]|nr:recombinase family protein [Clostridia bacterium]
MKKAVIYARYRGDASIPAQPYIEEQIEKCMCYAQEHDIQVKRVYTEIEVWGVPAQPRVIREQMILDSASHEWDTVLVTDMDKLARKRTDAWECKHRLEKNGVTIEPITQKNIAEEIIIEQILIGMEKYEARRKK